MYGVGTLAIIPQPVYCMNCGQKFLTDFQRRDGRTCSDDCDTALSQKRERAMDSDPPPPPEESRPVAKRKPQPI